MEEAKEKKKEKPYKTQVVEAAKKNHITLDKEMIIKPDEAYLKSIGKQVLFWFQQKKGAKIKSELDDKQKELILRIT